MAPRRVGPQTWLANLPPPTTNNQAVEALFLEDHWHYGGRVHEETARALVSALGAEASEMYVGHNLYLRLFTEYATALETLGAWGWAFRHYREHATFLDTFLAYPHSAPREFFTAVRRNRSGALRPLLQLSRSKRLDTALAEAFDIPLADFQKMASLGVVELKKSASQYFGGNEIIRTTYNKAKHGGTIFRTADLDGREFYVLAPHLPVRGVRDKARYDVSKFTVNRTMIRALETGCAGVGAQIRFLAGVARGLLAQGLLYR
jgi:hypothetical protein